MVVLIRNRHPMRPCPPYNAVQMGGVSYAIPTHALPACGLRCPGNSMDTAIVLSSAVAWTGMSGVEPEDSQYDMMTP